MESAGEPEDGAKETEPTQTGTAEDEAPAQTGEETEAAEAVGESEEKVSPEEDKKDE